MKKNISMYISYEDVNISSALKQIDEAAIGVLFVINKDDKLVGSLSDGDIRRWLIKTGNLNEKIYKVMNTNPVYVSEGEDDNRIHSIIAKRCLKAVPVVNKNKQIIDVVNNKFLSVERISPKRSQLLDLPVVIMAGGKGTRLYPYTKILPKALIPVGDIPIVERIMDSFYEYGCTFFYLILNHKRNMIKAYFNDTKKPYHIVYEDESTPLKTGGGISLLKGKIKKTFILTNCDILIDEDISKIITWHKKQKDVVTMVCSFTNYSIPYGVVELGKNGSMESIKEKPEYSFFTNTGCYIVEPEVIEHISRNEAIDFPSLIMRLKNHGNKIGVYPIGEHAWRDMGELNGLQMMNEYFEKSDS